MALALSSEPDTLCSESDTLYTVSKLVERVRENEAKLRSFRNLELRLIAAEGFFELYGILFHDYRNEADHDGMWLVLADSDGDARDVLTDAGADLSVMPGLSFVSWLEQLTRLDAMRPSPVLASQPLGAYDWLVSGQSRNYRSLAVMPLKRGQRTLGVLTFGSRDPGRFTPDSGTELLQGLAAVLALCIENTLNRHRLEAASVTDPTTRLRNRRFLDDRLVEELNRSRRDGTPLSFMLFDIDHFKRVNDSHGHPAGDATLVALARRAQESLRATDLLCRYGGEEFGVLMPNTRLEQAQQVAERLRLRISSRPFKLASGERLDLTISGGVATRVGPGFGPVAASSVTAEVETLCESADQALYRAKQEGRNRVCSTEAA